MHTGEITTITDSPQIPNDQTDEIWAKAKKHHVLRGLASAVALAVVLGSVFTFFDDGHFIAHPTSETRALGVLSAALAFVGVMLYVAWQVSSNPERYVSPLPGLPSDDRRQAREDINAAHLSGDARLRWAEVTHARQQARMQAQTPSRRLVLPAVYLGVVIVMFVTDSPALGILWLVMGAFVTVSNEITERRRKAAEQFLAVLP